MKNRWIALYVENEVGVLAKVSGLFSGKSYNLQSLTVGTTEDETISRMTICVTSDDITFEKTPLENLAKDKQLNAYKHYGFWRPMDNLKDKKELTNAWVNGVAQWAIWQK